MSSFVMPHGPLFLKDLLFMPECSLCKGAKKKIIGLCVYALCWGWFCSKLMWVNEFGQRRRESFLSARSRQMLRIQLLCRQRDGKQGNVLFRSRMLCGLHRADSCWSGLHMWPYFLPHASTLFLLEHNRALKKTSLSEWDSSMVHWSKNTK